MRRTSPLLAATALAALLAAPALASGEDVKKKQADKADPKAKAKQEQQAKTDEGFNFERKAAPKICAPPETLKAEASKVNTIEDMVAADPTNADWLMRYVAERNGTLLDGETRADLIAADTVQWRVVTPEKSPE